MRSNHVINPDIECVFSYVLIKQRTGRSVNKYKKIKHTIKFPCLNSIRASFEMTVY